MRKFGVGEKGAWIYGQRLLALVSILMASAVQAFPCDQPVMIANWSFCATGKVSAEGGEDDWKVVPPWTRQKP